MTKADIKFYSNALIQADVEFLKYQIAQKNVTLIANSGLQKLIDECQSYVALPANSPIYNTTLKPLLVLYSFSDTLRMLWMKRKDFRIQLSAMNTGTYEYGVIGPNGQHNFKDFELELFTAAYLNEYGVDADLPQTTAGNDVLYKDIEIQCKHPDTFTRNKIDGFLRDFQSSLQRSQKYGVFGIGVDDFLAFTDESFPIDYQAFEREYRTALLNQDQVMQQVFDSTLPHCPRVLGVYLINTHFTFNEQMGLTLAKTTNSVFCLRPNARAVPEETHIQAYEVVSYSITNHQFVFINEPDTKAHTLPSYSMPTLMAKLAKECAFSSQ